MATFNLPNEGDFPWDLNPAITAINSEVETATQNISNITQSVGTAGGFASLDSAGDVPYAQLPIGLSEEGLSKSFRKNNTAVIFGDSITASFGPFTNGVVTSYGTVSYWTWAQRFLGQRFKLLKNAGISGQTSAQILSRFDVDVKAYEPAYVIVLAGRNDGTIGAAATEANLAAIYDKCAKIGATVIACTLTPYNQPAGATTQQQADWAAQRQADNRINQWIKRQALTRRDFLVCDWATALQDINGNFIFPSLTADGIHPTSLAAQRMGRILAKTLAPRVPFLDRLVSNNDDPNNLDYNPLMFGTSGSIGSGGTGTLATGWNAGLLGSAGTFSIAQVPCTDLVGLNWHELNVTATGTGGGQLFQYVNQTAAASKLTAAIGTDDYYVARVEVEADSWASAVVQGTYAAGLSIRMQASNASFSNLAVVQDILSADTPTHEVNGEYMVLETPPMKIPSGTVNLQLVLTLSAIGKVRVRRFGIQKVLAATDV